MQADFDAIYKRDWVTNLKKLLFSNRFGLVWLTQGVGDEELFMKSVVLRLTNIAKQTWNSEIDRLVVQNSQLTENLSLF